MLSRTGDGDTREEVAEPNHYRRLRWEGDVPKGGMFTTTADGVEIFVDESGCMWEFL